MAIAAFRPVLRFVQSQHCATSEVLSFVSFPLNGLSRQK